MGSPVELAPINSERLNNYCNLSQKASKNLQHLLPFNQENILQNPNILKEKQIEDILKNPLSELRISKDSSYLPNRYCHMGTSRKSYVDTVIKLQDASQENILREKRNVYYRYQSAHYRLLSAEIHRACVNNPSKPLAAREKSQKNEEGYIKLAREESLEAKNIDPLHPLSYYIDCLILEYKGVDCTDMAQVEEYVRLLRRCVALDPQAADIQENLDEVKEFLQNRWSALETEGTIDAATRNTWQQKLNSILTSDPLKDLFRSKPELFNLARLTTHKAFFDQHPELKSKQAFVARYPECAQELGVELSKPAQAATAPASGKENVPSQKETVVVKVDEKWKDLLTQQFTGIRIKKPDGSFQYFDANVNLAPLTHSESNFLQGQMQQLIAQKS